MTCEALRTSSTVGKNNSLNLKEHLDVYLHSKTVAMMKQLELSEFMKYFTYFFLLFCDRLCKYAQTSFEKDLITKYSECLQMYELVLIK